MYITQSVLQLIINKSAWYKHLQLTRYSDNVEVLDYREQLGKQLIILINDITKGEITLTVEDLYFYNQCPKIHSTIYNTMVYGRSTKHSCPPNILNQLEDGEYEQIQEVHKQFEVEYKIIEHFKLINHLIRVTDCLFKDCPTHERRQYILRCLNPHFFNQQILLHPLIRKLVDERHPSDEWYSKFSTAINFIKG